MPKGQGNGTGGYFYVDPGLAARESKQSYKPKRGLLRKKGERYVKKYELTSEVMPFSGCLLHRIRALASFDDVAEGDLGGFVEQEGNLAQKGDAWVYGDAMAFGGAQVFGNAKVLDSAMVYGDAAVCGDAQVSGRATVFGNAFVHDSAKVYGNAMVHGNAKVYGIAQVCGDAVIFGNAHISDNARVSGNAHVSDNVRVSGNAQVSGDTWASGDLWMVGNDRVPGNVIGDLQPSQWEPGNAPPSRHAPGHAWKRGAICLLAASALLAPAAYLYCLHAGTRPDIETAIRRTRDAAARARDAMSGLLRTGRNGKRKED